MTSKEYLASYAELIDELIDRLTTACGSIPDEAFDAAPSRGSWSPAQIIEHMIITNRGYLPIVGRAVNNGVEGDGDVRHTRFGKMLVKMAGPEGNAKAPKWLVPPDVIYGRDIVERWIEQHREVSRLASSANSIDLARTKFRHPYLRLLKMNLFDAFEVIVQHAERHVGQIEVIAEKETSASRG